LKSLLQKEIEEKVQYIENGKLENKKNIEDIAIFKIEINELRQKNETFTNSNQLLNQDIKTLNEKIKALDKVR
jgi:FtsZ-binding cell division protein ZapB